MPFTVIGPDRREYDGIDAATLRRWLRQRRIDHASPAKMDGEGGWLTVADFTDALVEPPPPVPVAGAPPPIHGIPPPVQFIDGVPVIAPMDFDRPPPSYLLGSVLASFFVLSCLPVGLFALWFSLAVGRRWRAGDREGAERASFWARTWCLITLLVAGPLTMFFYWLLARMAGLV